MRSFDGAGFWNAGEGTLADISGDIDVAFGIGWTGRAKEGVFIVVEKLLLFEGVEIVRSRPGVANADTFVGERRSMSGAVLVADNVFND